MNARILAVPARVALAATLAIGAAACGPVNLDKAGSPVQRPVVLTLIDGESDISNAQPFARAVRVLSHGTLRIKIEGDWRWPSEPNYETELIKNVQAGKAELGITASRAFDTVGIDSFQALQAPFLIDSYPLEQKVLDSGIPAQMLAGLKPHGLVGLAVLPGPLRRPLSFGRPLLAAADYKGARIAIRPSRLTADIFRALGAIPVTQARGSKRGERTTGLTGIDGDAVQIDAGFAVPGTILTGNVVFEPRPNVIFMNQRAYNALRPGQRALLMRAGAQARTAGIFQGNDTASAADLCRRGTVIASASPADLAGLRAAVRPVYRLMDADPATKAYISQITAMKQASGGAPGTLTCPRQAVPANQITTKPTALDGTWQVAYTQNELIAAGDCCSTPPEGNWGQFTLKFSHGHWWQWLTGGDPAAEPNNVLLYGTYVLTGNEIIFYRHDHDYTGSDTEVWGPYLWSDYRDMLTFRTDAGINEGPVGLVVKPWRKTGT
jgi:TRAP-type C4-dicarboxylate transport system substrate-binding protein